MPRQSRYFGKDIDTSITLIDRALALNPSLSMAWQWSGCVRFLAGLPDLALEHPETGMRLSPRDPFGGLCDAMIGTAHFLAGRFDEAIARISVGLEQVPSFAYAYSVLAAASAHAGRLDAARQALARLRAVVPHAVPTDTVSSQRRPELQEFLRSGLRRAAGEAT